MRQKDYLILRNQLSERPKKIKLIYHGEKNRFKTELQEHWSKE